VETPPAEPVKAAEKVVEPKQNDKKKGKKEEVK